MQNHSETLAITGAIFSQLELRTQIFLWASYGDFYFSNFNLPYFNKYCMDFNPVKRITEAQNIGYLKLKWQLVKHLLKVRNLRSKNYCGKVVGWKSLLSDLQCWLLCNKYLH